MRILLVDDNPRLAEHIRVSLVQSGYTVDVAHSAAEGDELAHNKHHDVIILDVMLPDRDGIDLCRDLRRQHITAPILMLTVLSSTKDMVAGLDAGADDYLTKPFRGEELLARLRSLLRRSQSIVGGILQSGDLVMDLPAHQVSLAGNAVKLSAKEFGLLEFMMRNPRKLLTRTMICESVWSTDYEPDSNVIDVYVASLRRKLDQGSQNQRIQTVIGSGYRFVHRPEAERTSTKMAAPAKSGQSAESH